MPDLKKLAGLAQAILKEARSSAKRHLGLRLPDDLHAALVRCAKEEDRSLHSLIIHLLRQAVASR
jgi:predicted HicB family RNase H-like nuclease